MKLYEQLEMLRHELPVFDPIDIVVYVHKHLPDLEDSLHEHGIDIRAVITGMAIVLVPLREHGEIPQDLGDVLPDPESEAHEANVKAIKRMNQTQLDEVMQKIKEIGLMAGLGEEDEEGHEDGLVQLPPELQAFLDEVGGGDNA